MTAVSCDPRVISTSLLFFTPANEWHLFRRVSVTTEPGSSFEQRPSGIGRTLCTSWTPKPVKEMLLRIIWGWKVSSISFSSSSPRLHSVFSAATTSLRLGITPCGLQFLSQSGNAWGCTQLSPRPSLMIPSESRCFKPSFVIFRQESKTLDSLVDLSTCACISHNVYPSSRFYAREHYTWQICVFHGSPAPKTCLTQLALS